MDLDIAVITTRYVMTGSSPILYVYRDEEGDWQFMGREEVTEKDAKVVSLHEILAVDKSIEDLLHLEPGYMAYRDQLEDDWQIKKNIS